MTKFTFRPPEYPDPTPVAFKGAGVWMKIFQKYTFWLFLIEETDIYQTL